MLTAFLLKLSSKYCFDASSNDWESADELEYTTEAESTNKDTWLSRMDRTRWRDNSFERMACDLRSRSLSVLRDFMVSLHKARKTRYASLIKRSRSVRARFASTDSIESAMDIRRVA